MKKERFIAELEENESCDSSFLVKAKTLGKTRSGNPFLRVRLTDQTGETEGRIWERALEFDQAFSVNDVVRVRASVERYQGKLQLNISDIERLDPEEVDPTLFLPTGPHDVNELWQQFEDLAKQVKNQHLQRLLQSFLADRTFVEQMKQAPAAKSMHHAYLGGLLEHTVSVTRLLGRICDHYPRLDRDLLITAAILHDIGLIVEDQVVPEEFHKACHAYVSGDQDLLYTGEDEIIGTNHTKIGAVMAQDWKLPDQVVEAIRYHHNHTKSYPVPSVISIIQLAEFMVCKLKYGVVFDKIDPLPKYLESHLKENMKEYRVLLKSLPEEMNKAEELFKEG